MFDTTDLYIGACARGEVDRYFSGAIDDLRIYEKTLSYDDVEALYKAGVKESKELLEPTKKLVAYYGFDGDLKDSSDFKNNAEKVAVGGTTKYISGMNGKAITMSKGNYIRVPAADQLNFKNEFTVSLWVKATGKLEDEKCPLLYRLNPSYGHSDNDNDCTYNLMWHYWNDGTSMTTDFTFYSYSDSQWLPYHNYTVGAVNYNGDDFTAHDWQHLTYTFTYDEEESKAMFKLYINGVLAEKTDEIDYGDVANASGDLYIGYNNDEFFTGAIDELKIYNKCLDMDDVLKEYKRIDKVSIASKDEKAISSLAKGKSYTISAITLKDADSKKDTKLKASDVTFKTSNKKVFTVSKKGAIKAVKKGKATLTVDYGGNKTTYKVVVK